ncbi:MAG TPA: hypothetical protein VI168_09415 [Croceibacterium sp.]
MAKQKSTKYLYEVSLDGGRSNPQWQGFYDGVTSLNGKSPDFVGITRVAVVGTHHSAHSVKRLIAGHMDDDSDLEIEEITNSSLQDFPHSVYGQLIRDYFLPYGDYPNVEG